MTVRPTARATAGPIRLRVATALLVPAGLGLAAFLLWWAAAAPIQTVQAPGPAPVDSLVALGAALACAGLLALSAVGALLWLLAVLTGQVSGRLGRLAGVLTPRSVRAVLAVAVGVTVAAAPVAGSASAGGGSVLPGGWSPDRPAATATAHAPATGRPATRSVGTVPVLVRPVVVHPGDTLWAIAARSLGGHPTNALVAASWPQWYATNRATIGPDPDLIVAGQRLRPPHRAPADDSTLAGPTERDREESP